MDRILHRVFDIENINFIPFPGEARREAPDAIQQEVDIEPKETAAKPEAAASGGKAVFSKSIPKQLRVLRETLTERSHTTDSLAEIFKRKPRKSVEEGLQSLILVGVAEFEAETQTWHTV